jgi:hypothetical protein
MLSQTASAETRTRSHESQEHPVMPRRGVTVARNGLVTVALSAFWSCAIKSAMYDNGPPYCWSW